VKASRISKIAGIGFLGFVAAATVADRVNLNPVAAQFAGFAGAFLGSMAAKLRIAPKRRPDTTAEPAAPTEPAPK
jgi:hypothetical protein